MGESFLFFAFEWVMVVKGRGYWIFCLLLLNGSCFQFECLELFIKFHQTNQYFGDKNVNHLEMFWYNTGFGEPRFDENHDLFWDFNRSRNLSINFESFMLSVWMFGTFRQTNILVTKISMILKCLGTRLDRASFRLMKIWTF